MFGRLLRGLLALLLWFGLCFRLLWGLCLLFRCCWACLRLVLQMACLLLILACGWLEFL